MGLLRKAAGAAARGTSIAEADAPHSGSGLLRKSIGVLEAGPIHAASEPPSPEITALSVELLAESVPEIMTPVPESPTVPEPPARIQAAQSTEEIIEEVITSIAKLPEGVELPAQLFSMLVDRFQIQKGALLLFDAPRLVYAPWASHGFDQTTLRKIRVPLGANESFNALANGAPIALTDAAGFGPYQQFFSAREFSSLTRMILTPFIAADTLVGVLLLTQCDPPFAADEDFLQCLSRVSAAAAPRMSAARAAKIAGAAPAAAAPRDGTMEDQVARFLTGIGASPVLFLSLSVEEYALSLTRTNEHLDPFRLHEDIFYFLTSFVADVGKAFSARQGLFLLGVQDLIPAETDLFLHQLTSFLHGLFGGNGDAGDSGRPRILRTVSWPADTRDPAQLIRSLTV